MDTWEQSRFARTFFFSFKDIWRPIILGTKSQKKTSGLKKSLLGPLWGLSYFSKGDTLPFSSPPSFSRRNPPVEAGGWSLEHNGGWPGGVCWICMQLFSVSTATKANQSCINRGWQASPDIQTSCLDQASHTCLLGSRAAFHPIWSLVSDLSLKEVWNRYSNVRLAKLRRLDAIWGGMMGQCLFVSTAWIAWMTCLMCPLVVI